MARGPFGSRTRNDRCSPLTCTTRRTSPITTSSAPGAPSSFSTTASVTGLSLMTALTPRAGSKRTCVPLQDELADGRRHGRRQDDVVLLGTPSGIGTRFQRMQSRDAHPIAAIVSVVLGAPLLGDGHRRLAAAAGGGGGGRRAGRGAMHKAKGRKQKAKNDGCESQFLPLPSLAFPTVRLPARASPPTARC